MTTQAISIPTIILGAHTVEPEITYLPIKKFGKISYFGEIEVTRTREAEVVSDMLDANHTDIVRVIAIDLANKGSWDATRDIADAIFNQIIRTGSNVPEWLVDFLEANISSNELAPYLRQLAA